MTRAWAVVSASQTGSRHNRNNAPNQDAHIIASDGAVYAIGVADGHGSAEHFRSGVGAEIAARVSVEALLSSVASTVRAGRSVSGADGRDHLERALRDEVGPVIASRWRQEVFADVRDNPFDDRRSMEELLRAYGTTVLAMVVTPTLLGVLQIGDGDAVVVFSDGEVLRPLPEDPFNVGVQTSSLCQANPMAALRTAVLDTQARPVDIAWASTDGFGSPQVDTGWWREVGAQLAGHLRSHGIEWIREKLPRWLDEPAQVGGDDTTVAVLLSMERAAQPDGSSSGPTGTAAVNPR